MNTKRFQVYSLATGILSRMDFILKTDSLHSYDTHFEIPHTTFF